MRFLSWNWRVAAMSDRANRGNEAEVSASARFDASDVQRSEQAYVALHLFEQLQRDNGTRPVEISSAGARMFGAATREAALACD